MKQREYKIGASTLTLAFEDLTTSTADVLVSSDDSYLTMGGGVSAAIRRVGGDAILIDAAKRTPCALGTVVVTTAGFLKAKHVFHAITLGSGNLEPAEVITRTTRRCLELLDALELSTIAFPAIGAGVAGFSYEDVAVQMSDIIVATLSRSPRQIGATIYLYDRFRDMQPIDFVSFFENIAVRMKTVTDINAPPPVSPPSVQEPHLDPGAPKMDTKSEKRKAALEALAELDKERGVLEGRLAHYGGAPTKKDIREIAKRLSALQERRIELLSAVKPVGKREAVPVFVSYSHVDERLRRRLDKHLSALERQGLIATWHDHMIPAGAESSAIIDEHLEKARVILFLVSSDFVGSQYCYDGEVRRALERHNAGQAIVIPIILRPAVLDGLPFSKLQSLPRNAKAVTDWANLDAAFVDITKGLRDAIIQLVTTEA